MIGVTLFGIFLTPVFYSVITALGERKSPPPAPVPDIPARDGLRVAAPAVDSNGAPAGQPPVKAEQPAPA
jgi:hypothetical protein